MGVTRKEFCHPARVFQEGFEQLLGLVSAGEGRLLIDELLMDGYPLQLENSED